jgi:hypothetical protein
MLKNNLLNAFNIEAGIKKAPLLVGKRGLSRGK